MNLPLYIALALVLIPAAIIVFTLILLHSKDLKFGHLAFWLAVMGVGIAGLIFCANISKETYYEYGYAQGTVDGAEAIKTTSEFSSAGYGYFEIKYADGSTHHFEYEPEDIHEEEEGFGAVKTYESYTMITSPTARQTKLNNLPEVYTDENGMRRIYDYYLVALGSYYGSIGDIFEVTLSTGRVMLVIKGDAKADEHTVDNHRVHYIDGSVIEFIVDQPVIESKLNGHGDCSYISGFEGSITKIELIGHYNF